MNDQMIFKRIIVAIVAFTLPFVITAIFYFDRTETYSRNKFVKVFNGLSHMPFDTYLNILPVSILLSICILILLNYKYNHRNIIVGFDIDKESKILSVRTKTLSGTVSDSKTPFPNIIIASEQLSDGWTNLMYDCLTISNNGNLIGHFYKNHDMWSSENSLELEQKLRGVKTAITI